MIFDTIWFSLNAILPIVIMITIGYYMKKLGFVDDTLIKKINTFVFSLALPLLFFYNIYQTPSLKNIDFGMPLFIVAGAMVFFVLGFFLRIFKLKKGQTAVVHQALMRTNFAMIGMTLATLIGDETSIALVSLTAVFIVPLVNILNIIILVNFNDQPDHKKLSLKETLKAILTNPLQIGVMLGIFLVLLKTFVVYDSGTPIILIERDLPFVYTTIKALSVTASPLALIVIGAQFELHKLKESKEAVIISIIFRNIVIPGVMVAATIWMIQLHPAYVSLLPTVIAVFASPVAVSSVVLVSQLGGDTETAGQIVVWTTLMSSISIFVIISILRMLNYL